MQEGENFEEDFEFKIECSNQDFKIIYNTNGECPTLNNSTTYATSISITETVRFYVMGVLLEDGEIIERTDIYHILFFDVNTPLENCFSINKGDLCNYTGYYEHLTIPSKINSFFILSPPF